MSGLVNGAAHLGVLGKIEHHGTGAAASGYIECTAHGPCHIFGRTYLVSPFTNGLCDVHHVALLKGICAQHLRRHLSGDDNDGGAVHHGVSNARDGVGGSGTARDEAYAHTSAGTGIPLGSMCRSLFVAHQHMVQTVAVVVEGIIHGHDSSSGITEEGFHTFVHKRLHQDLGTGECWLFHIECLVFVAV